MVSFGICLVGNDCTYYGPISQGDPTTESQTINLFTSSQEVFPVNFFFFSYRNLFVEVCFFAVSILCSTDYTEYLSNFGGIDWRYTN